ncbi:uncharacterized protein PHALS_07936 [Plasmopara halstedii]|uniref:Uncharacterized protein n=1 Tax=Plasmopara halstedii TaxID=4781 RepID=A0A0P1B8F8_PLAHL|nr:uncharacterized protein PHALS_07936 [Plasmopara halstedii]CEG50212.1 hypothetical protein PHALS_07936 [Plasmopara halstedii]|eukprot:XP_024586581.1 hypothetical protein PHALS_07936 [Plasmopara halstedii]
MLRRLPGTSSVRDPSLQRQVFQAHWGAIMGNTDSCIGPPPIANPDNQRELLDTIEKRLTPDDQT